MTHRGPFQPLLFCDSVIPLPRQRVIRAPQAAPARAEGWCCLSRKAPGGAVFPSGPAPRHCSSARHLRTVSGRQRLLVQVNTAGESGSSTGLLLLDSPAEVVWWCWR